MKKIRRELKEFITFEYKDKKEKREHHRLLVKEGYETYEIDLDIMRYTYVKKVAE